MTLTAHILGSGSTGNALYIEGARCGLIVDAGLPISILRERMHEMGLLHGGCLPKIDGVVITHAHSDHWTHADSYSEAFDVPTYASESCAKRVRLNRVRVFGCRTAFRVGRIVVAPTPVLHDTAQVALTFTHEGAQIGLATDLGDWTPPLVGHLRDADVLLIEANHDREMLANGTDPPFLKSKIASRAGHLSNDQTAALLRAFPKTPREVVLMHISLRNNKPARAADTVRPSLHRESKLSLSSDKGGMSFGARGTRAHQLSLAL